MKYPYLSLFTFGKALKRIAIVPVLLFSAWSFAGSFEDTFFDPVDNQLDLSNWLLEQKGVLPVPIVITEPAVGYGGGLAGVYFHGGMGGGRKHAPPSVSAIAAAKTENGTWFLGGGHQGIWYDDTVRYTGGIGTGLVKMQYYGLSFLKNGIAFETEANFLMQEIQFRLWDSSFFAGISYLLLDTENTFKAAPPELGLPGIQFDDRSAAVSLLLNYDNRNNMFTPSTGIAAEIEVMDYSETWGGDENYNKYKASILSYTTINPKLVLGLRADVEAMSGDAPFYAYPFIDMRGIKAMQYQGDQVVLGEIELRWEFANRWWLVGFGGAGRAYSDTKSGADDSDMIYSKGLGLRYLIANKLGLQMGLDIAVGPDDTAFYIQFGSSWSLK
ncbi:MAG: BamA/TamA family outer membrane protein [Pseudomonadales bacterium]|nr:BamA/TamA family outer membrane protein [Pseudomonadales bacterium]